MSYNTSFQNNATRTLLIHTDYCLFMFTNRADTALFLYLAPLFHSFSLRDLSSAYSHRKTTGIPIAKKMSIVNTKLVNKQCQTENQGPIPKVASQRFVRLSISIFSHLLPNVGSLPLIIFNIFVFFI